MTVTTDPSTVVLPYIPGTVSGLREPQVPAIVDGGSVKH